MNSQERVLYILQRIAQEPCSTQQLTQEIFGSDQRNKQRLIQMDIARLKQHFPHQIITLSQRHKLIKVPYFLQNLLSSDGIKIKELIEFLMVFDNKMLSLFEQEEPHLIQNLRKEIQEIYLIHEPPLEMIDGRFLESIKRAIKHRQYVNLDYQQPPHRLKTYAHIQLHRIIYAEGNWYLAIHQSKSLKPYNLLRINFIQSLEALMHNQVDAVILVGGDPLKKLQKLNKKIKLLSYQPQQPLQGYQIGTIQPSHYPHWLTRPIRTLTVDSFLITNLPKSTKIPLLKYLKQLQKSIEINPPKDLHPKWKAFESLDCLPPPKNGMIYHLSTRLSMPYCKE